MQWQSSLLTKMGVLHGCTDASAGVLRYDWASDEEVVANREALRRNLGFTDETLVLCQQVHGNEVLVVDATVDRDPFVQLGQADAMITNQPDMVLVIKTADCVPVFLYDPVHNAVAVIHSGWKGTLANIISTTVSAMQAHYQTNPSDLYVAIGPSICNKHYDVSETTDGRIERFAEAFNHDPGIIIRAGEQTSLDLPAACKEQCRQAGISQDRVDVSGICTYESTRWPSYRRDGEDLVHDIWSYVAVSNTKA
jgi:YfiH family protein